MLPLHMKITFQEILASETDFIQDDVLIENFTERRIHFDFKINLNRKSNPQYCKRNVILRYTKQKSQS